jgi:carbon monoxide dehydrogenase subunit G
MATQNAAAEVQVNNSPHAVIDYVANIENRPSYLPSLKSVSNITGESVGANWTWCWSLLGIDFEGTATCTQHETGQSYAFKTEGGIESTFTYQAEADGAGTKLTINVDFELPASILSLAGLDNLLASAKQKEMEAVVQNLKTILDQ